MKISSVTTSIFIYLSNIQHRGDFQIDLTYYRLIIFLYSELFTKQNLGKYFYDKKLFKFYKTKTMLTSLTFVNNLVLITCKGSLDLTQAELLKVSIFESYSCMYNASCQACQLLAICLNKLFLYFLIKWSNCIKNTLKH